MKKVGLVGTGGRGCHAFAGPLCTNEHLRTTALCDINAKRLQAAADMLKQDHHVDVKCYTDYGKFLNSGLDMVFITTPDFTHADLAIQALNAGKDVFVDKPMATNVADCLRIYQAMKKSGRKLFLGFNLRYDPVCRKIKELIDAGVVGRVVDVSNFDFYDGGKTYMARWNRFYAKSGGLFCHKGSHDFDIMNWYLDMRTPIRVSAFGGVDVLTPQGIPFSYKDARDVGPYCRACRSRKLCPDTRQVVSPLFTEEAAAEDSYYPDTCIYLSEKDTHDNAVAIVEYEGGARISHWECFFTPVSTRRFVVMGDRGHLEADISKNELILYPRWRRDTVTYQLNRVEGGHGGADPSMLDVLTDACVTNRDITFASVREGIASVAIAQAAEISRREHRTVEIKELLDPAILST